MREKTKKLLVTFHTTAGAMAMEKHCKAENLPGRLIPVPRSITADCGLCWMAPLEERLRLEAVVTARGLDAAGFYEELV